ncbi:MAG: PilZ domain-containing protein [Nitrospirae bacterium]|nr:PilZ domain-containing protein [Nitrospirota bacterium]
MKYFHLIETTPNGLKTVKTLFEAMNADCRVFNSVEDALGSGKMPDMVILLAQREEEGYRKDVRMLSLNSSYGKVPRVAVLPISLSMKRKTAAVIEGEAEFPLPVDKEKFLSAIAACLNISQRRICQIIITIVASASNLQYSGISMDFSETGMGFESRADFSIGQGIKTSFVNPGTKIRLLLQGEVARKVPTTSADRFLYGIRFVDMQKQEAEELRRFIAGKKD